MCNQTVGLVQAALEEAGIATVSISLLREVTKKVQPPRAFFVPYPHGYPLGRPHDVLFQRKVILEALQLLQRTDIPLFEEFSIRV